MVPSWGVALVLAVLAPWGVRVFVWMFSRKAHARTAALLDRAGVGTDAPPERRA